MEEMSSLPTPRPLPLSTRAAGPSAHIRPIIACSAGVSMGSGISPVPPGGAALIPHPLFLTQALVSDNSQPLLQAPRV